MGTISLPPGFSEGDWVRGMEGDVGPALKEAGMWWE